MHGKTQMLKTFSDFFHHCKELFTYNHSIYLFLVVDFYVFQQNINTKAFQNLQQILEKIQLNNFHFDLLPKKKLIFSIKLSSKKKFKIVSIS